MKLKLPIVCLFVFLLCGLAASSQDKPEYAAILIPDSLKQDAWSVIREETQDLKITAPGKGTMRKRKVITVLSEKGEDELVFQEYEDNFKSLGFAEVHLYDAMGNHLKRYKKKEMEKARVGDGFSLITDHKTYYFVAPANSYPVTVEFISEIDYSGFINLPYFLTSHPRQSVISSRYSVSTTPDNPIRYKRYHCDIEPVIQETEKSKTYTWTVNHVRPCRHEPGSAAGIAAYPNIAVTATRFEMQNYTGDFNSWQSLGRFFHALNTDVSDLSMERKAQIIAMLSGTTDERQKIALLYKYLQQNFRYVSIQLGIGGFKPFPASYVDKNKFGDCKALSNYMKNLLDVAGIKSHYALVNAGSSAMPADPEFPNDPFNHVILCVPQQKDTVWLECTSQEQPFARLGAFTENRYALLVTDQGGVLTATPQSKPEDNIINTSSVITFNEDGSGTAAVRIAHSGEEHDRLKSRLWNRDETGRKEYLIRSFGFKQFDNFSLGLQDTSGNYATSLNLDYEKIHDFNAGSKYFLRPHLHNVWSSPLAKTEQRTMDYFFEHPFTETDSSVYKLPENFTVESLPKPVSFNFSMGGFESRFTYDANTRSITSWCRLVLKKHRIPAAEYNNAKVFFDRVISECEQKIVVKKG